MEHNSIKKNYIYNLMYQMLAVLVPLITTPYISRALGAEGVGAYSFTTSIVSYFALFGNFGIATYGQLRIAANRDDKEKITADFVGIFLARFVVMTICILIYIGFVLLQESYKDMYAVLTIQLVATALDISWLLQGLEEFKKIIFRNIIIKIASVVLVFAFVKNKDDLILYAVIMQGAVLLGNLSIYVYLATILRRIKWEKVNVLCHLAPSFSYFIPTIATSIYMLLDKSMIGWITNSEYQNGIYEQAHKIEQMAVTVVTSLSMVTLPRMTFLYRNKEVSEMKSMLHDSIKFILWISLPMAFGFVGIARNFIYWFLGDGYEGCVPLLRTFALLIVVVGLNNAVGKQVLMAIGKQREYNISVICGAAANFVCNLILIPIFQAQGAAVASVIAETIILIMFLQYSKSFILKKEILHYSINNVVASVLMALCVEKTCSILAPNFISIMLQIIFGVCVYIGGILILRDQYTFIQVKKAVNRINLNIKPGSD